MEIKVFADSQGEGGWQNWFAWYPVRTGTYANGTRIFAWMESVWRKTDKSGEMIYQRRSC